jgi:hypothetical protein
MKELEKRITDVIKFYYKKGVNKESVNKVYFKILDLKFKNYGSK